MTGIFSSISSGSQDTTEILSLNCPATHLDFPEAVTQQSGNIVAQKLLHK